MRRVNSFEWVTLSIWVLLFSSLLTQCAGCTTTRAITDNHTPRPLAVASFGVQCQQIRDVYCVVDHDLSEVECKSILPTAIGAINLAVGRPILHFAGSIDTDSMEAVWKRGDYLVGVDHLPPNILGLTKPELLQDAETGLPCITKVFTILSPEVLGTWAGKAPQVVIHEMLHALGFGHSEGTLFTSIMMPAVTQDAAADHITQTDINSLRAVYNRGTDDL